MTIGGMIDEVIRIISEWFNQLAIKEKIDAIIESNQLIKTFFEIPGKMAESITENFTSKQWGWILVIVFCTVSAVILWKSLEQVVNFFAKILLVCVAAGLFFAVIASIAIERVDVAILLVLLFIVALVVKHFYPKPPQEE